MQLLAAPWTRTPRAQATRLARGIAKGVAQGREGIGTWAASLHEFIEHERWRDLRSSQGAEYADFGEIAIDLCPFGLGVRDKYSARVLKQALFMHGHAVRWAEVLVHIARARGRPKNRTAGEGFVPFYSLHRSSTSLDRIVLRLHAEGRVDLLAAIGAKCMSAKAAALEAGFTSRQPKHGALRDTTEGVSTRASRKSLRRCFLQAGLEAQCALIANELQPHLGMDLAQRWRMFKRGDNQKSAS
jgi:hypothetical protein